MFLSTVLYFVRDVPLVIITVNFLDGKDSPFVTEEHEKESIFLPTMRLPFRELPELSRQFILRLLFVNKPIQQVLSASWIPQHEAGRSVAYVLMWCVSQTYDNIP